MEEIKYVAPKTVAAFIQDYIPHALFYDFIVGPYGSGKTTGLFFKLAYMAGLQEPGPDGIRRTRAVVVRNTAPQLRDTTLVSWNYWFKNGQAGIWRQTDKNFLLKFGDVECEVLFRPLDTADDVQRVLSLEVTFAVLDEFVEIPKAIIEALSGRLGRYPSAKDGGATNWGMWGASNPSTEDNWWFDYLHDEKITEAVDVYNHPKWSNRDLQRAMIAMNGDDRGGRNVRYFQQPGGLSDVAENLINLPPRDGTNAYYKNLVIGKTEAWVKQFVDADWGYSAVGKPVIATFKPELHVPRKTLLFQPNYPLVGGFDPGIIGTAMVFGQEDMHGRLIVLGEIFAQGVGVTRFISDLLKPYLFTQFPSAKFIVAPDPAAANRAQTDETPVVEIIRKNFEVSIESNNRLPLRIDAIESYTTRLTEFGPALLVDRQACPMLCRGLAGAWRFAEVTGTNGTLKAVPEKNDYSHVCDAFGYLARFYARQYQRRGVRGQTVTQRQTSGPPMSRPARYHFT